jgi:hypothetical protein
MRTKRIKGMPLVRSGIPDGIDARTDGTVDCLTERAYRRGYMHGANDAWLAVSRGMALKDIAQWIYKAVHDWRYNAKDWFAPDRAMVSLPPEPGENVKAQHWRKAVWLHDSSEQPTG